MGDYKGFSQAEQLILKSLDELKDDVKKKCVNCHTTISVKYHWIALTTMTVAAFAWLSWITKTLYAHTTELKIVTPIEKTIGQKK